MAGGWRLLRDPPGAAAWNMSVDEALLEHAAESAPTLRLYTWARPALSLGYRQRDRTWLARASAHDLEPVRRCTGGGAVLHTGDLTYAVCAAAGRGELPDGLAASYEWIRSLLLDALATLGLAAQPARASAGADRAAACFAGATGLEIELSGTKLIGSAQRRTPWGFLQHGSIRLRDDSDRHVALFGSALAAPAPPPEDLATLTQAGLAEAIERAFAKRLAGALEPAELSPSEQRRARERAALRARDPLAVARISSSRAWEYADRLP
jgi:lipoate-protein ligase A